MGFVFKRKENTVPEDLISFKSAFPLFLAYFSGKYQGVNLPVIIRGKTKERPVIDAVAESMGCSKEYLMCFMAYFTLDGPTYVELMYKVYRKLYGLDAEISIDYFQGLVAVMDGSADNTKYLAT